MANAALLQIVDLGKLSYADIEQTKALSARTKLSIAELIANEHALKFDYEAILEPPGWRNDRRSLTW